MSSKFLSKFSIIYVKGHSSLKEYEIKTQKKNIKILGNISIDFSLPFGLLNYFNINVANEKEYWIHHMDD